MTLNHAPAPWIIMGDDLDEGGMPFIQIENKMDPICRVSPAWTPDETEDFQITDQVRATANLISAAPELLAVCIEMREWLKPELGHQLQCIHLKNIERKQS